MNPKRIIAINAAIQDAQARHRAWPDDPVRGGALVAEEVLEGTLPMLRLALDSTRGTIPSDAQLQAIYQELLHICACTNIFMEKLEQIAEIRNEKLRSGK